MKRIYLYGLGGERNQYRIIRYSYVEDEAICIKNIISSAVWLKFKNPAVEHVYAVDERRGLASDYMRTVNRNTIESNVLFKDMCEREGIQII